MLKTRVFVMVLAVTGQVTCGNETVIEAQSNAVATASKGDVAPTVSTSTTTSTATTSSNRDGPLSDNVETAKAVSVVQSDPLEASVLPYGNYCPTDHSSYKASYQQPTIQETFLTQQPVPYKQYYQPSDTQVQSVSQIQPFPQQYTNRLYDYRQPYVYYQGYPPSFAANAYQRGFISKPCDLTRNKFC